MKKVTLIFSIFLLTNCSNPQDNFETGHKPSLNKNTNINQKAEILIENTYEYSDSNYTDYWCSTNILLKTKANIDKLDLVLVADFLATFHESCKNNIEYSEWSNELLFKVINNKPDKFLEVISKNSSLSREYIINELTNPLHDQIDLIKTIETIKKLNNFNPEDWKSKIIIALETAKKKKIK